MDGFGDQPDFDGRMTNHFAIGLNQMGTVGFNANGMRGGQVG